MNNEQKQYAERDIEALDEAGDYYFRHVSAMTGEGLHGKSRIAAELAFRDSEIDRLKSELEVAQAGYAGGGEADSFWCTNCGWKGNALRDHKGLCSELYMERHPAPAVPDKDKLLALIEEYWDIAWQQGFEQRHHDDEKGSAQNKLCEIQYALKKPAPAVPDGWDGYQALADVEDVDLALRGFAGDPTGDAGVIVVRAVCQALTASKEAR